MEAMEDDGPNSKDDHNHNYCPSGGGKVRASYVSSQLSDAAAGVKQSVRLPVSAQEQVARWGKVWSGTAGGSKFMDSDSSSESSEVSELEGSAPSGSSGGEGKFTLDTTSKFRKLVVCLFVVTGRVLLDAACDNIIPESRLKLTASSQLQLTRDNNRRMFLNIPFISLSS